MSLEHYKSLVTKKNDSKDEYESKLILEKQNAIFIHFDYSLLFLTFSDLSNFTCNKSYLK